MAGGIYAISGANAVGPSHAFAGAPAAAVGTSCVTPSIAVTIPNTLLIFSCAVPSTTGRSVTEPPEMTGNERWDRESNGTYIVTSESAYESLAAPAMVSRTGTVSGSEYNVGFLLAVAPR